MEAGKFSFKFSRQTQKNIVGSSKYAYFSAVCNMIARELSLSVSNMQDIKISKKNFMP
jgi:hypothetical protein